MTPTELLNEAKAHFPVLYVEDTAFLNSLLKKTLGKYQDKAGVLLSQTIPDDEFFIDIPTDFLAIGVVQDARGNFHDHIIAEGQVQITKRLYPNASVPPFSFSYFLDLRNYDSDTDLPDTTISLLLDHLEASIDIYNTARAKRVAQSTGQDTVEFPSEQELKERRAAVELEMEDNMSIVPVASVHFYERGYS